ALALDRSAEPGPDAPTRRRPEDPRRLPLPGRTEPARRAGQRRRAGVAEGADQTGAPRAGRYGRHRRGPGAPEGTDAAAVAERRRHACHGGRSRRATQGAARVSDQSLNGPSWGRLPACPDRSRLEASPTTGTHRNQTMRRAILLSLFVAPTVTAAPDPVPDVEQAVKALSGRDAVIVRDEDAPGKPVVRVSLANSGATDADL